MTKRKRSSNTILCVKNFPDYLQANDLQQYFKEIGKIKDVTIFYDKQSRAKAYIEYTSELTEDALKFNKATIENEKISLRFAIPQDREVIISNVPSSLSLNELKNEYLENIGKVEHVESISSTTYKVRFESIQATRDSLNYNGADIEGQVVSIQQLQLSPQELQKILLSLDTEDEETETKREASKGETSRPNKKQKTSNGTPKKISNGESTPVKASGSSKKAKKNKKSKE